MGVKLTDRERHFLTILCEAPDATIGVGLHVGARLLRRGLVSIVRWGRYGATQAGRDALAGTLAADPAMAAGGAGKRGGKGGRGGARKPDGAPDGNTGQLGLL